MADAQQFRFSDLIAPLTPADIAALWRDRELKLQRRSGENRFFTPLDWNGLWRLVKDHIVPAEKCRVTYGRRVVPPEFYTDDGKINSNKLARLFDQGTSMIVVRLDPHVPTLAAAFQDAAKHGIRLNEAGAIVTTGSIGALETHYDFRDLIILQVEGSKRWRIYGPRVAKPSKATFVNDPPQTPPVLDVLLQANDMLFVPAGFWHICDNGPSRSLHLGLFLRPPAADRPDRISAMRRERT
jgi:hypothetical protein